MRGTSVLPFVTALAIAGCAAASPPADEPPTLAPPRTETRHLRPAVRPPLRELQADELAAIDVRPWRQRPRSANELVGEFKSLDYDLKRTSEGAPELPHLQRTMAETSAELEWVVERSLAATAAPDSKPVAIATAARGQAIKYYLLLLASTEPVCDPEYDPHASDVHLYGDERTEPECRREIGLALAIELWSAGALDGARKTMLDVISQAPNSADAARAYFIFGVIFEGEGKASFARMSFTETLKMRDVAPAVAAVARRRLDAMPPAGP